MSHYLGKKISHPNTSKVVAEEGLITEIRAYYASLISNPVVNHELGDFDYSARGYPIEPPSRSDR